MKTIRLVGNARGVAAAVLILVFLPVSHAWGGETEKSGRNAKTGTDPSRELTLSLRIAEVKGNETVRTYVRCLLRQNKRKSLRHNPQGSCGIPVAVDYNKDSKPVPEGDSRMTIP